MKLHQSQRHTKVKEFLGKNLKNMFESINTADTGVSQFLIQHCLYPRLMLSPGDAIFCIKFLQRLVDYRVPKINVLNVFA